MNKYIVTFHNRFAQQTQTYQVSSENEFRAGREFYRKYNRKAYYDCIENITKLKPDKGDEIVTAINMILRDEEIDNNTKIERIEAGIEGYISNNSPSLSDMT